MGVINNQAGQNINRGGGNRMAFGLTAEQAATATGDQAAVAAWYEQAHLDGGVMRPDREVKKIYNEDNDLVDEIVLRNEYIIEETSLETDDATLDMLEALEGFYFPVRKPLPVRKPAPNGEKWRQMWYFPKCRVEKTNDGINTDREERKRKFVIRAVEDDNEVLKIRATVDVDDDTSWPPELEPAKDAAFAAV
jgi:hypothetical protein